MDLKRSLKMCELDNTALQIKVIDLGEEVANLKATIEDLEKERFETFQRIQELKDEVV